MKKTPETKAPSAHKNTSLSQTNYNPAKARVRDAIYRQIGLHVIRCKLGESVTDHDRRRVSKAVERVQKIELELQGG